MAEPTTLKLGLWSLTYPSRRNSRDARD